MNHPRILGIGTASPAVRLTQEQSFHAAGYQSDRIRRIFLNSDIEYRHFYLEDRLNREESSDQLNQRYLRGAVKTGCRAILNCIEAAGTTVHDVDLLAVCTCTGYVCPDVGSRLIAHMGFRNNVQRTSVVGLGCAGALPALQRAVDFVRASPGRQALMLAGVVLASVPTSRFARLATTSITHSKQSSVTRFALMAPRPSCLGPASKPVSAIHKLSTLRLSSIPSKSRRLDFSIAVGSFESCSEPRFNTWPAP